MCLYKISFLKLTGKYKILFITNYFLIYTHLINKLWSTVFHLWLYSNSKDIFIIAAKVLIHKQIKLNDKFENENIFL